MKYSVLFLFFLFTNLNLSHAQYPGYTPVVDTAKFRMEFSAAARSTNSIKSDFIQEKSLSMLSEKIISKGKFWFKKNNKVRMEYSEPFQYLLIINQDKVFMKDGTKSNTVNAKSNKLFQQITGIIVDCVQGTVLTNKDFKIKVFENKQNYLIEMTPVGKGLKEFFSHITITASKINYAVTKMEMNEISGDLTVMDFTNREMNIAIPDALFTIQ